MSATTPKKLNIDQLADLFVNRCFARALPDEALKAALDAIILWNGLQANYDIFARFQNAAVVRPDDVADHLPGQWETLKPEVRKRLRAAIREKERVYRQNLRSLRDLIFTQASSGNAGSQAFQTVFAEREAEYLSQPIQS